MHLIFLKSILIFCILQNILGQELRSVTDHDIVELVRTGEPLILLFTKNDCKNCEQFEQIVEKLQDDFKESLNAVAVISRDSEMSVIYDPNSKNEAILVYYRMGVPYVYYGEAKEHDILHKLNDNREPVVKELTDSIFEHVTQASTGATTGDWLIFFYSSECFICQRLFGVFESLAAEYKRRMNFARVNTLEAGISTAKRFSIKRAPEFVLFRHGKMYYFRSDQYTMRKFIKFLENDYKNQKGEPAPHQTHLAFEFLQFFNFDFGNFGSTQIALLATIICVLIILSIVFKNTKDSTAEEEDEKVKKGVENAKLKKSK